MRRWPGRVFQYGAGGCVFPTCGRPLHWAYSLGYPGYSPASYSAQVSTSPDFPAGPTTQTLALNLGSNATSVSLPGTLPADALRFVLPSLAPNVSVYLRVAAEVPPLLPEVVRVLPRAVGAQYWALGGPGGCACNSWLAGTGAGCSSVTGAPLALAPQGPVLGECECVHRHLAVGRCCQSCRCWVFL